jgi:hypothetical protein
MPPYVLSTQEEVDEDRSSMKSGEVDTEIYTKDGGEGEKYGHLAAESQDEDCSPIQVGRPRGANLGSMDNNTKKHCLVLSAVAH